MNFRPVLSVAAAATLMAGSFAIAGCDRQDTAASQAEGDGDDAVLTGEIDRSHAGEPIPEAVLTLADGTSRSLDEFSGQPVLVNLWATWCAPCVLEMPMLDDLAKGREGELSVLTVSQDLDGADKVAAFFDQREFAMLRPWLDPQNALGFAYGTGVLPTTVYYGSDGREIWRVVGGYDWSGEDAAQLFD
ncbi:TlpA family protein disulfide reductase [Croceicoccus hydrothermalis]|uniref:TlpA family protein disulfide reductase n=1 Tax=Croceicoccus hydrothermalis TaxID=2867964 RepID=UPI001EFA5A21|nr:TlpA disulfide reductase family protein [Croceicoccus hydrothermalis]